MHKIVYVKTQFGKQYMYLGDKESFKIGDIVSNDKHDNMTVINVFDSEKDTYNGHPIKQLISKKNMQQNGMFGGIVDKYKSQFIPQKENDIKMSLNGILCVPIDGEYVGIGADNELTAFTPEMVIDIPVYSISKTNSNIQVGDIIKNGRSYAKVISKNADGSLKTLSYSGYTHNKKEIKDFLLGQSTSRVLINMFNFDDSNGFNPIFFAMASGDSFDVESLMMLAMTPQGKNLFSNSGGSFNPMMLMAMMGKNKDMFGTMAMMSMFGGQSNMGGMFGGMFGQQPTNTDK